MIKTILFLRIKQFSRILDELGFFMVLLFLFMTSPLLLRVLEFSRDTEGEYFATYVGLLLLSTQLHRGDKAFLALIYPQTFKIYLVEYLTFCLPVWVWLFYLQNWIGVLILLAFTVLVPFIKYTLNWKKDRQLPLFSLPAHFAPHYEWISGVRKYWGYFALIYVASVAFCTFPVTQLVCLFLMAAFVSGFYLEGEPAVFLELAASDARAFLHGKIKAALVLFWGYCSPMVLLFMVFHWEYWYVLLVVMVVCSLFPIMSIVVKYATYQPEVSLKQNGMVLSLMIAFLCFPFTQPVPLLLTYRYYNKAVVNLRNYLVGDW